MTQAHGRSDASIVTRRALHAPENMCEAYDYPRPSAFSRGLEAAWPGMRMIFISGTASVGPAGQTLHPGDFKAQARRAFENVRAVLADAGAAWTDVVKVTVYLRDIGRDYAAFNEVRSAYFREAGIRTFPASTCVQALLCREDLLVEMEALAIVATRGPEENTT
ncbi:MAG: RidA family protein [Phycisphaerae bacterium]|jgi:enamine deaminase RidA (YjgF/YER057c/UK114 family)